MDGILLINKPQSWTSHDVCNFVKKRFKISKVGHTGTLDPQATGVLVLLLGTCTKLSARLASFEKEYEGTIELGIKTTTQDGDGEIVESRDWRGVTEKQIKELLVSFKGPQKQIPPMVSAIRSNGIRLYKLARKGQEVERKARDIVIYEIICNSIHLPYIDFTICSSKGTYVRTVAYDIGERLGTGAYLKSLCRVRNGSFHVSECIHIDELKKLKIRDDLKRFIRKDFFIK
ncbi:MAG: tRNA pseudouridine(55) synthase TruB [Candidatus Omnitrophica bacterium]|nr:tRNA pseudouridine(55) synthase TruB [Candidatus Omnitrophota bacterium]